MKIILLSRGKLASVDDEDYERVSAFRWSASKRPRGNWYAVGRPLKRFGKDGKRKQVYMHQFILNYWKGIDHKDGFGLNNQKHNLRPATQLQNMRGRKEKRSSTSSRFRGVCRYVLRGNWRAYVSFKGRQVHLGIFSSEVEAAKAYDIAARKYFGEFASPNFP